MLFQVLIVVYVVVNNTFLPFEVNKYGTKATIIPISQGKEALWCSGVPPPTECSYEGG